MAILPVAARLDLKKLATAANAKKAELADPKLAEKTTGYVVGGISPLGGRKTLPTFLDESACLFDTIFISAGQRGLQIEMSPNELQALTDASLISFDQRLTHAAHDPTMEPRLLEKSYRMKKMCKP